MAAILTSYLCLLATTPIKSPLTAPNVNICLQTGGNNILYLTILLQQFNETIKSSRGSGTEYTPINVLEAGCAWFWSLFQNLGQETFGHEAKWIEAEGWRWARAHVADWVPIGRLWKAHHYVGLTFSNQSASLNVGMTGFWSRACTWLLQAHCPWAHK